MIIEIISLFIIGMAIGTIGFYLFAIRDIKRLTNRIYKHSFVIKFYCDIKAICLQDMYFIKSDYNLYKRALKYDLIPNALTGGDYNGNEIMYLASLGMIHLREEMQKEGIR